ncbi:hypothetical protein [Methylococcus sp. EFPC2]|uniref:hypothetical protein n=1 Tax=Methylococcus sp. EFPC2 TaxID=2812648 RepID=UPI00196745BE|nr:hypothetical protein [Methylococcus sp. EFPC2]QSA98392.1 hypothetical protein JWZ97_06180 [Methylococcus sp. EFPC2]
MLSALTFDTARPAREAAPERTDIACFIGYVARRAGAPLPKDVGDTLRAAGWVDGPWRRDATALESLEQIPVTVDSWDDFARLFAWERRPLRENGGGACAAYLGAAVRSYFARGGRRAIVIRVADPFPHVETGSARSERRDARLNALIPGSAAADPPVRPFDPADPGSWRGIQHLYGLPEVSQVCLPDLPDICAADPQALPTSYSPPPAPEVFVECSEDEPPTQVDTAVDRLPAPFSDEAGFLAWRGALAGIRSFLGRHRRDALFVGALPLAAVDTRRAADGGSIHAEADLLEFLRRLGVLETQGSPPGRTASAFLQLGWPWLHTRRSQDLPALLEPPDGLLAGTLAANALSRGTFRSVGGTLFPEIAALQPEPATGGGPDSPTARLAERLCVFAREPEGIALLSDVTTSAEAAWRFGGASRIMAAILRAARRFGEAHLFEPNGPQLWTQLRRSLELMLFAFWREGGLSGATAADAFSVRCDRSTMTQTDLDEGRLKAEIRVLPAAAITHITVVLDLIAGSAADVQIREVA